MQHRYNALPVGVSPALVPKSAWRKLHELGNDKGACGKLPVILSGWSATLPLLLSIVDSALPLGDGPLHLLR
jgi:hypothetical protein